MLKKIKSLFVIEESDAQGEKGASASREDTSKEVTTTPKMSSFVPEGSKGQIQNKFLEVLFSALESHNQDGFDYLEFKDFLRSLANVPMDDSIRYKSAFATAQTMGATKEKILSSARSYMDVLTKEDSKFQEALISQREKNLISKQHEIKKHEQSIQEKQAEIEKLKADIEGHRQQIGTLENEINAASDKLAQTAADFQVSYAALLGQIQSDVKNIETHIQT